MKKSGKNTQIVVQPTDVSQVKPIYNTRGRIVSWQLVVETKGSISKDSYGGYFTSFRNYIANVPTPKGRCDIEANIDVDKSCATVKYLFSDGLFGCGFKHAWDFRIQVLSQITKRNIKKIR